MRRPLEHYSILAVDEQPEVRQAVYDRWMQNGATVVIEPDMAGALRWMRARRFGLVVLPADRVGEIDVPGAPLDAVMEAWARRSAPGYRGRFVFTAEEGTPAWGDLLSRGAHVFPLAFEPGEQEVEAALAAIEGVVEELRRG